MSLYYAILNRQLAIGVSLEFGGTVCACDCCRAIVRRSRNLSVRRVVLVVPGKSQIHRPEAREHGYDVLRFESPFHTGAFSFWTTSRGQVVYSITIRDGAGCERKAWVRCGSYFGSVLFSAEIEVRWQDQPSAA